MKAGGDRFAKDGGRLVHVNTFHGGFPLPHSSAEDRGQRGYAGFVRQEVHLSLHHHQRLGQ